MQTLVVDDSSPHKINRPDISGHSHQVDRVSVPSPIAIDMLMDTMARDRVHIY